MNRSSLSRRNPVYHEQILVTCNDLWPSPIHSVYTNMYNSDKLLIRFFYLGGHFISFKDPVLIILNSQERRCIMLASRQIFPVVTIKWKPLDDFLLVRNIVIKTNLYSIYTSGFRFTHYTFSINIFNVLITEFFYFLSFK